MSEQTEALVFASSSQQLDGETPDSIVFMPKGEWAIHPMVNGKSEEVNVAVNSETAEILQRSLETRMADSVRPYAAFDHRPGPASFLPKAFRWDDERGVILEVDWTKAGREAVTGRDYSYFSPTFLLNSKKVAGLPKDGEIGSLTNNPAFRKIQRIAASRDDPQPKTMNKIAEQLVELQVITAQQAESDDEELLIRAIRGMHDTLAITQKANDMLKKENTDLALKVQAVQEVEADGVIREAVEAGKIPSKDEKTIAFFKEQYLRNPSTTREVLASLQGSSPIGKPIINVKASDGSLGMNGRNRGDLIQAQKTVIAEIQESHPNMTFDTAFNKARMMHPELFVEA